MQSTAIDVKDMLEAESGLGLVFLTNLFVGKEPTTPDNCVTIYDTPGYPPLLTLEGDGNYHYPSIQVRVRNRSYVAAMGLGQQIMWLLHGRHSEEWNGSLYCSVVCLGDPALLDWDANNRAVIVVNFSIQRRNIDGY